MDVDKMSYLELFNAHGKVAGLINRVRNFPDLNITMCESFFTIFEGGIRVLDHCDSFDEGYKFIEKYKLTHKNKFEIEETKNQ